MIVDFDRYLVRRHRRGSFPAGDVTLARHDGGVHLRVFGYWPTLTDLGAFRSESQAWAAAVRDATEGRES